MINIEVKYPVILFRNNDKNLYWVNRDLGLISKGGDNFYKKKIKMVDRNGQTFELVKATNGGKAKFIDSLKYFQPMQQMNLKFQEGNSLTLEEVKSEILEHIKQNPRKWLSLGTIDMIEDWIDQKKSHADLYKIF